MTMSWLYCITVMFRPISPIPPKGMTRRVSGANLFGSGNSLEVNVKSLFLRRANLLLIVLFVFRQHRRVANGLRLPVILVSEVLP